MLTIGISTIAQNYEALIKSLENYTCLIDNDVVFLVCVQGQIELPIYKKDNISIIFSKSKGLSKSRNIIIDNSHTKWLWFQDDDISLSIDNVIMFIEILKKSHSDIFLSKICSLESSLPYKNYNFHYFHSIFNCLKVSSIEIIVNLDFIKKNSIYFNEKLGLGTPMPSCEENLFVYKIFKISKNIKYLDSFLCFHTSILANRNIDYTSRFIAKGYLMKCLSFYVSFPFFIKSLFLAKQLTFIKRLKYISKGFFSV